MKRSDAVFTVMQDELLHTLSDISAKTGFSEASVSAQLREFRWPKWGFNIVKEVVLVRGKHRTYGYRFAGKADVLPKHVDRAALLSACLRYLRTFKRLDVEGDVLKKQLEEVVK